MELLKGISQEQAAELAAGRKDFWVKPGFAMPLEGPYGETKAREILRDHMAAGRMPQLLKVIEDYKP